MKCPNCQSDKIRKNVHRRGKQNYHCKKCDRQLSIDNYGLLVHTARSLGIYLGV